MRIKGLDPDGRSLVDPSAGIGTASPQGGQFRSKFEKPNEAQLTMVARKAASCWTYRDMISRN